MLCGHCDHENPPNARYCNQCGQSLQARAIRNYTPRHLQRRILENASAMAGERKPVTVLFVDIVDSVELSTTLGEDDWHQLLDAFFGRLTEAVHAFDGTVNQYTGDGIMALFGAPIALERHAEMAARAALRILESLRPLADDTLERHRRRLRIRQGLNSGEVVVAAIGDDLRMDYTAKGQITALAARLESHAAPNTILLSGFTAALLSPRFLLSPLRPMLVKGIEHPVSSYRLHGVREVDPAEEGPRALLGRETELAQLHEYARSALAGPGQVVRLHGETGVGKEAVLRTFLRQLPETVDPAPTVYRLQAEPHHRAEPALLWRRLMAVVMQQPHDAEGAALAQAFDALCRRWGLADTEDAAVAAAVAGLRRWLEQGEPPAPGEAELEALVGVVEALLRSDFPQQPAVVLLSNLQDLDAVVGGTVLEPMLRHLQQSRWLIVATYRSGWQPPWLDWVDSHEIEIGPLPAQAGRDYLDQLLGTHRSLLPVKRAILRAAAGNPLHIREAARELQASGVIEKRRRYWVLREAVPPIPVPASIRAALSARVDALPPTRKSLLQVMAVIGSQVRRDLLHAVSGLAPGELERQLGDLEAAQMLRPRGQDAAVWRFSRPALREVCLQGLLREQRQTLHRTVAAALGEQEPLPRAAILDHLEAAEDWPAAAAFALEHAEALGWPAPQARAEALQRAEGLASQAEDAALALRVRAQRLLLQLARGGEGRSLRQNLPPQAGPPPPAWTLAAGLAAWLDGTPVAQCWPDVVDDGGGAVAARAGGEAGAAAAGPAAPAPEAAPPAPASYAGALPALLALGEGDPARARRALRIAPPPPALAALLAAVAHGLGGRVDDAAQALAPLCGEASPAGMLAAALAQLLTPYRDEDSPGPVGAGVATLPADYGLLHELMLLARLWAFYQSYRAAGRPAPVAEVRGPLQAEQQRGGSPLLQGLRALFLVRLQLDEGARRAAREQLGQWDNLLAAQPLLRLPAQLLQAEIAEEGEGLLTLFRRSESRLEELRHAVEDSGCLIYAPWVLELQARAQRGQDEGQAAALRAQAAGLRRQLGWRVADADADADAAPDPESDPGSD